MTGKAAGAQIKTPSDGYRALTVDICLDAVKAGAIDFFETNFGKICLDYLGINPEMAVEALNPNRLEIVGDGDAD